MEIYELLLLAAVLTIGLVAGLFFTFTTLIMPGLSMLNNADYLKSFQAIDRILQGNAPKVGTQPYFAFVFFGAIMSIVACLIVGYGQFDSVSRLMTVLATAIYGLGMLLPTVTVNLPLNNEVQTYHIESMAASELKVARNKFERRWNNWNLVRTLASVATFTLLTLVLLRNGS